MLLLGLFEIATFGIQADVVLIIQLFQADYMRRVSSIREAKIRQYLFHKYDKVKILSQLDEIFHDRSEIYLSLPTSTLL